MKGLGQGERLTEFVGKHNQKLFVFTRVGSNLLCSVLCPSSRHKEMFNEVLLTKEAPSYLPSGNDPSGRCAG